MKFRISFIARILSALLILPFILPPSSFALRPSIENDTKGHLTAGMEQPEPAPLDEIGQKILEMLLWNLRQVNYRKRRGLMSGGDRPYQSYLLPGTPSASLLEGTPPASPAVKLRLNPAAWTDYFDRQIEDLADDGFLEVPLEHGKGVLFYCEKDKLNRFELYFWPEGSEPVFAGRFDLWRDPPNRKAVANRVWPEAIPFSSSAVHYQERAGNSFLDPVAMAALSRQKFYPQAFFVNNGGVRELGLRPDVVRDLLAFSVFRFLELDNFSTLEIRSLSDDVYLKQLTIFEERLHTEEGALQLDLPRVVDGLRSWTMASARASPLPEGLEIHQWIDRVPVLVAALLRDGIATLPLEGGTAFLILRPDYVNDNPLSLDLVIQPSRGEGANLGRFDLFVGRAAEIGTANFGTQGRYPLTQKKKNELNKIRPGLADLAQASFEPSRQAGGFFRRALHINEESARGLGIEVEDAQRLLCWVIFSILEKENIRSIKLEARDNFFLRRFFLTADQTTAGPPGTLVARTEQLLKRIRASWLEPSLAGAGLEEEGLYSPPVRGLRVFVMPDPLFDKIGSSAHLSRHTLFFHFMGGRKVTLPERVLRFPREDAVRFLAHIIHIQMWRDFNADSNARRDWTIPLDEGYRKMADHLGFKDALRSVFGFNKDYLTQIERGTFARTYWTWLAFDAIPPSPELPNEKESLSGRGKEWIRDLRGNRLQNRLWRPAQREAPLSPQEAMTLEGLNWLWELTWELLPEETLRLHEWMAARAQEDAEHLYEELLTQIPFGPTGMEPETPWDTWERLEAARELLNAV